MEHLKWLVENTKCGDVNGDSPEDLNRILKAERELHAILMLLAKDPKEGQLNGLSATIDIDLILLLRNAMMKKGKKASMALNDWLRSHEDELKKLAE